MVLDASLLNTQHYKVRIKGKVEQSREGVAPSPTHWCSSYRKGSLRVTLDYGRQLYLLTLYGDNLENCQIILEGCWYWLHIFPRMFFFSFLLLDRSYRFGIAQSAGAVEYTDYLSAER